LGLRRNQKTVSILDFKVTKQNSLSDSFSETRLLLFERRRWSALKLGKRVLNSKTLVLFSSSPVHGII